MFLIAQSNTKQHNAPQSKAKPSTTKQRNTVYHSTSSTGGTHILSPRLNKLRKNIRRRTQSSGLEGRRDNVRCWHDEGGPERASGISLLDLSLFFSSCASFCSSFFLPLGLYLSMSVDRSTVHMDGRVTFEADAEVVCCTAMALAFTHRHRDK